MSDGGAEPGGSPVLLAEPAATGRAREKAPTRAELESALRAGGGGGGAGGGFKDIPGTSAVSPGSSKQCAPDTESPSGTGEADYCRRILVRDAKGTIREIVLPKGLDLDRPKRTRTSFTAEQLYRLELEFQRCQSRCGSRTAARSRRRTRAGTLRNAPPAPPPSPSPPATSCGCWSRAACSPCRRRRASCPPLPTPPPATPAPPAAAWPRPRGCAAAAAAAAAPRHRRLSACRSRLSPPLLPRRPHHPRRRRGCRRGRCASGRRCWAACTTCPAPTDWARPPSSLTRGWRGRTVRHPARSRALKKREKQKKKKLLPQTPSTKKKKNVSKKCHLPHPSPGLSPPRARPGNSSGGCVPSPSREWRLRVDVARVEAVTPARGGSGGFCVTGGAPKTAAGVAGGGGTGAAARGWRLSRVSLTGGQKGQVAPGSVPAVTSEKRRASVSLLRRAGCPRCHPAGSPGDVPNRASCPRDGNERLSPPLGHPQAPPDAVLGPSHKDSPRGCGSLSPPPQGQLRQLGTAVTVATAPPRASLPPAPPNPPWGGTAVTPARHWPCTPPLSPVTAGVTQRSCWGEVTVAS